MAADPSQNVDADFPDHPHEEVVAGCSTRTDDAKLSEAARRQLEKAETGDADAAQKIDEIRKANPAAEDAAEQAASDGPGGMGLAR